MYVLFVKSGVLLFLLSSLFNNTGYCVLTYVPLFRESCSTSGVCSLLYLMTGYYEYYVKTCLP